MQDDMKKLIAYSSVAHMGYVTLGIFTLTKQGIEGSIFQTDKSWFDISAIYFRVLGLFMMIAFETYKYLWWIS